MKSFAWWVGIWFALAMAAPADAGWNIKQKESGGTVWENSDTGDEVPVGNPGLIVEFSDPGTALTKHVVSHRSGYVEKVYFVVGSPAAGSNATPNVFTFWLEAAGGASNGQFTQISGLTLNLGSASSAGSSASDEPAVSAGNPNVVLQGQVIAIATDGAGTGATPSFITIVIE